MALTPNKKLPTFVLSADPDPDDLSGLSVVSLVVDPAIQQKFQLFGKAQKQRFGISDQDRRIVSGPALLPNEPIYRNDESGEYNVVFTPQSIECLVQKFFCNNRQNNASFEHDGTLLNGIYLFESYIVDSKRGNMPNKNYANLPDGTWFVSFKVENDDVWQALKSGQFTGFSVEGLFDHLIEGTNLSQQLAKAPRIDKIETQPSAMKLKFYDRAFKAVFGRTKFAQEFLTDGTIIQYDGDALAEGQTVFMHDPAGNPSLLANGDYLTKDSTTRFTIADGVVTKASKGQAPFIEDETKHQAQSAAQVGQPSTDIDVEERGKFGDIGEDGCPDEEDWIETAMDAQKPYGDVDYAYVDKDGTHKYPIDTEEHIRAAWNYINKTKNAALVDGVEKVKEKIISAWKSKIDPQGPPSAQQKHASQMKKTRKEQIAELKAKLAKLGADESNNDDSDNTKPNDDEQEMSHEVDTKGSESDGKQPGEFDAESFNDLQTGHDDLVDKHAKLAAEHDKLKAKCEDMMSKHKELADGFEAYKKAQKDAVAKLSSQVDKFATSPAASEIDQKKNRNAAEGKDKEISSAKLENMFLNHKYRNKSEE